MGGKNGFTLVEIMIGLAIATILAGFAAPALRHYSHNVNLKTAARTVATDLFNTRMRAVAGQGVVAGCNSPFSVSLDTADNGYEIRRCTASPSTFTTIETKPLASFGPDIIFNSARTTRTNYTIQSRGTVANGTIVLQNGYGSEATIVINMAGRTHVTFTMR